MIVRKVLEVTFRGLLNEGVNPRDILVAFHNAVAHDLNGYWTDEQLEQVMDHLSTILDSI